MILSTHGVIASQIQSFVGLLDTYPNAAAAYSLRKLRAAYTGNAIRVRRSSDNTETNIGFTALGNLDESALTTFCSGTNGFVTTWYDQSGNGLNATQSTAINQPQIVSAGAVLLQGSKPTLRFDGINNRLSTVRLLSNNVWSIFSSLKINSMANSWNFLGQHNGSPDLGRLQIVARDTSTTIRTFFNNGTSYSSPYTLSSVSNNFYLISSLANNDDYYLSVNGVNEQVRANQTLTPLNTNFTIGSLGDGTQPFNGNAQEILIYVSDQSSNQTNIETNINDFYSIY